NFSEIQSSRNSKETGFLTMISINNISKSYGTIPIFTQLSFTVNQGESFAIVGASGRGKTTLLYLMAGLDHVDSGSIIVDGQDITLLDEKESALFRSQHYGFIFQHHFLLNDLDALENTLLPLRINRCLNTQNRQKVLDLFDYFQLADRLHHFPDELSGGEKQRIALIRALAGNAPIIFADEPSGSLDKENAYKLQNLLLGLSKEHHKTLILSTHNLDFAKQCDRCYSLDDLEESL
ncbi:MAG: ABC transporter ATP-binding protein, partial [Brevinema sp.]